MRNILSYQSGNTFTGKELNDFFSYAIENNTSQKKIAIKYIKHFTFKDNRTYQMYRGRMNDHSPECAMFIKIS